MKNKNKDKEIGNNVKHYQHEELFKKGDYDHLTKFYLDNAKKSLSTAETLFRISEEKELKKTLGLLDSFETYLWVITTAYYSMFYAVNALFSKNGIKVGDKIAHKVTSDLFYFYFIQNDRLAKRLFEIYEEVKEEALELTDTKYPWLAKELSKNLSYEMGKRHRFQYNMLESTKRSYAKTSLDRAVEFVNQIEIVIKS